MRQFKNFEPNNLQELTNEQSESQRNGHSDAGYD